jgi:hypothetical protein
MSAATVGLPFGRPGPEEAARSLRDLGPSHAAVQPSP